MDLEKLKKEVADLKEERTYLHEVVIPGIIADKERFERCSKEKDEVILKLKQAIEFARQLYHLDSDLLDVFAHLVPEYVDYDAMPMWEIVYGDGK